jgi:Mg-chelatase subunit ChlD
MTAFCVILCCATLASAQEPARATKSVNFLLTATAKPDTPLEITVREHKSQIPVESVRALDDVPHRLLLLADTSGSERMQQHALKTALSQFVADAPVFPRDTMAIAAFNSAAGMAQRFTSDRAQLLDTVEKLKSAGTTALYDSVIEAVGTVQAEMRKSGGIGDVIVVTDGEDNAS